MKRKLLSILALLCLAVTSAWADWNGENYTATANETITGTIYVGSATLTINEGVTVTVNGGIVISGTLTVTGGGTLEVTATGSGNAVVGDVIINGATVNVWGGDGGNGSDGGGWGGNGGAAFTGAVTIYSGWVIATGGNGGNGGTGGTGDTGYDSDGGDAGEGGEGGTGGWGGNGGAAFTGAVTIYGGTVNAIGGTGGQGGDGGQGGQGGSSNEAYDGDVCVQGAGGAGGWGGSGGSGGVGGDGFAGTVTFYGGWVNAYYGSGGERGSGGSGGRGGTGLPPADGGSPGSEGEDGSNGKAIADLANGVTFNTTTYTLDGDVEENYSVSISASDATPNVVNMTANLANGAYWTTFYSNTGNFIAPKGTQVFAVNLDGTTITMIPIEDRIVKSGEGVVLKQATTSSDATTTIIMAETTSDPTGDFSTNRLSGTVGGITTTSANDYYVLSYKTATGVGFYKLASNGTISANKAYLTYSGAAAGGAREFFTLNSDASGIADVRSMMSDGRSEVYDLQGRHVTQPTKGLYIVNGRKMLMK